LVDSQIEVANTRERTLFHNQDTVEPDNTYLSLGFQKPTRKELKEKQIGPDNGVLQGDVTFLYIKN
jgi:hypothetical protein